MDVFLDNFNFIWLNSFLAFVAVLFGWLMLKAHFKFLKILYGFVWLIFLPNTIYILTDVTHLFENWSKVDNLFKFILIIQYALLSIVGIITFTVALHFLQRLLDGKNMKGIKPTTTAAIIILNFVIGFGVVLGGIERTNSWYIITNPSRVLEDSLDLIYSPELLMLSLGIGLFANTVYFLMVEVVATWHKKLFRK